MFERVLEVEFAVLLGIGRTAAWPQQQHKQLIAAYLCETLADVEAGRDRLEQPALALLRLRWFPQV